MSEAQVEKFCQLKRVIQRAIFYSEFEDFDASRTMELKPEHSVFATPFVTLKDRENAMACMAPERRTPRRFRSNAEQAVKAMGGRALNLWGEPTKTSDEARERIAFESDDELDSASKPRKSQDIFCYRRAAPLR